MANQLEYLANNRRAFAKFQTELNEFQLAAGTQSTRPEYIEECRLRVHIAIDDVMDTFVLFTQQDK